MAFNRPLYVALAGGGASWLITLLVLGGEGLQFAVSNSIANTFAHPIALLSSAGAGFLAALAVAWLTRLPRRDLTNVLIWLLVLDIVLVGIALAIVGELGIAHALTVFLVVSAGGLQFAGVALAGSLATVAGRPVG